MDTKAMETAARPTLSPPSKKRKCPPLPPQLDLGSSAVLRKSWEFVSTVEKETTGRTMAPLTGSRLEAQLLVSLIESATAYATEGSEHEEEGPLPLERSMSGINPLPELVPGIADSDWDEFRRNVFC